MDGEHNGKSYEQMGMIWGGTWLETPVHGFLAMLVRKGAHERIDFMGPQVSINTS